jgi:hypothetical protein
MGLFFGSAKLVMTEGEAYPPMAKAFSLRLEHYQEKAVSAAPSNRRRSRLKIPA